MKQNLSSKKNKSFQPGFTLVELLLYAAIAGFVLLATSLFLSALLGARIKNQTIAEVEGQGMQALHIMTQAIRNADTINLPASGASASTLSINTIVSDNNPTVFDLASDALRIKEGTASAMALTNARVVVSALTFHNLSRAMTPGTIRIQCTLTAVNPSGRNEYSFSKTFTTSATLRQP